MKSPVLKNCLIASLFLAPAFTAHAGATAMNCVESQNGSKTGLVVSFPMGLSAKPEENVNSSGSVVLKVVQKNKAVDVIREYKLSDKSFPASESFIESGPDKGALHLRVDDSNVSAAESGMLSGVYLSIVLTPSTTDLSTWSGTIDMNINRYGQIAADGSTLITRAPGASVLNCTASFSN